MRSRKNKINDIILRTVWKKVYNIEHPCDVELWGMFINARIIIEVQIRDQIEDQIKNQILHTQIV